MYCCEVIQPQRCMLETVSFCVRVESSVSMPKVNTVNICIVIRTLSETDDSVANSEALRCCCCDVLV